MNDDETLARFEESLGLPKGFVEALRHEADDWSFTIKAHALVETGLTELLIHRVGNQQLDEILGRLPVTGQFSKVSFSRALDLLPDDGKIDRFITALGTLRNRLVHNIRRVEFSLPRYFQDLSSEKPDQFNNDYAALDLIFKNSAEPLEVHGKKLAPKEVFKLYPRLIIAAGLGSVLGWIHNMTGVAKVAQEMRRSADLLYTELVLAELSRKKP